MEEEAAGNDLEQAELERLLSSFVTKEEEESFRKITEFLYKDTGKCNGGDNTTTWRLTDLIGMLGRYLTSEIENERLRGSLLIAQLLSEPETSGDLNPAAIHLLIVFFCHRLGDYPSLLPSLKALVVLVDYHSESASGEQAISNHDMADILKTLFTNVHCPSFAQNIRELVYTLIHKILTVSTNDGSKDEMRDIAPIVLNGIITTMEGEKDPRCLLIALQIGAKAQIVFAEHLDESGDLCDVLFDNIACYFPITFSPPPDDPFGITPEALVGALEDCLCAGRMNLVKHTINFAINQVEGDSVVSRVHALRLLLRVTRVHGHAAFRSVGVLPVLGNLLYEVIVKESASSELVPAALTLVSEINTSIGQDMYNENLGDWQEFGFMLLQKVKKEIDRGLDSMQANGAIRIAFVIGNANSSCYSIMATTVLPVLLSSIAATKQRHRNTLLKALEYFKRNIQVLPSIEESAIFTTNGFKMLCQIINLSLGPVRNVSDDKTHSLASRHIDASQLRELRPLSQSQRREIFDVVLGFLTPFDAEAMGPVMGTETSDAPVLSEGGASSLSEFAPKADTISVISESIETMRVVLLGSSATDFDAARLEECIISVTDIFLLGEHCLWRERGVRSAISSGAKLDPIRKACLSFFRSVASQSVYLDVMSKHCIANIIKSSDLSMGSYQTVSTIISGSMGLALLQSFAPLLQTQLAASFLAVDEQSGGSGPQSEEEVVAHLANAESILLACEGLLQRDPYADQSIKSVSSADALGQVVDNERKASFLVGLDSGDTGDASIFSLITETIVGHSATLLRGCNDHNPHNKLRRQLVISIQMSFRSFLRRVVFALSQNLDSQTLFCVQFVELVMRHSHPDKKSLRVGASCAVPLITALLMNMDRQSPVFAAPVGATDVVRFGVSMSLSFLGEDGADASHWLETTGSRTDENADPSWALFGPAQLFSIIVNKEPESDSLGALLDTLHSALEKRISSLVSSGSSLALDTRERDLVADFLLWSLKAVSMRSLGKQRVVESRQKQLMALLTGLLIDTEDTSVTAAEFKYAVVDKLPFFFSEQLSIFSPLSGCNVLSFWKQKVWSSLFPMLRNEPNASAAVRSPLTAIPLVRVLAICSLVVGLPEEIIKCFFGDLVEVMTYAAAHLASNDSLSTRMKSQTVNALQILVSLDAKAFSGCLNSIIPLFLQMACASESAKDRIAALNGLNSIDEQISFPKLFPYVKTVLKGLGLCLNDKKCSVRQLAAKTKNKWMLKK